VPQERAARRKRRPCVGSTIGRAAEESHPAPANHLSFNDSNQIRPVPTIPRRQPKTETALSAEAISVAARSLARLPRHPKRVRSGWIGPVRTFVDMPIRLPDDRQAYLWGALRGKVVFVRKPGGVLVDGFDGARGSREWGVLPADQVQIIRNDAARLLGAQKAGKRERPSARKAASCRLNAVKAPRPGSRARGRPRTMLPGLGLSAVPPSITQSVKSLPGVKSPKAAGELAVPHD
jgi:hypothetical protein